MHRPWLILEARARGAERALAEDYVAEAFLRLIEHFPKQLPPEAACVAWLRQTILNLQRMGWRKQEQDRRARERQGLVEDPPLDTLGFGSEASTAQARQMLGGVATLHGTTMFEGELLPAPYPSNEIPPEIFDNAIQRLSSKLREAFRLWIAELPYEEIARRLGISQGTARKRVHEARRKLVAYLRPYLAPAEVN